MWLTVNRLVSLLIRFRRLVCLGKYSATFHLRIVGNQAPLFTADALWNHTVKTTACTLPPEQKTQLHFEQCNTKQKDHRRSAGGGRNGLTSPLSPDNRAPLQHKLVNHLPRLHTAGWDWSKSPSAPLLRGLRSPEEGQRHRGEPLGSLLHHDLLIRPWLKQQTTRFFQFSAEERLRKKKERKCRSFPPVYFGSLLNLRQNAKERTATMARVKLFITNVLLAYAESICIHN